MYLLIFLNYKSGRDIKNGAENVIRTHDPRITNALLYQLSYLGTPTIMPKKHKKIKLFFIPYVWDLKRKTKINLLKNPRKRGFS